MASGTGVLTPYNGANIIQPAPGLPSVGFQASGGIPYPQYGAQQLGIPTSVPQQVPQKSPLERFLKAEPKVLGAVQILIGLIHIGFGTISLCLFFSYYLPLAAIGGYPFWGGIFFISSGSLCVAAANSPNRCLVKTSIGLNITSAIMALSGIMLYMSEMIISGLSRYEVTLVVASLPARMASGTIIVIPTNGANIIQTASGLPNVAFQASGAIPYPQYGAQQLGISTSVPQQVPQKSPLERFLKVEPKVLGAVQILIGLIHIGFGAVSLCLFPPYYLPISGFGGYPFWGGIFFISSGSLCVAAANSLNHALVKSSTGLNITSAIMALIGIILYLCELGISGNFRGYGSQYDNYYPIYTVESLQSVGEGLSSMFLFFSVLEFCIAVSVAHFGCQAACCTDAQPTVLFVPYQVIGGGEVAAEPNPPAPPPAYDTVITKPQ